MLLTLHAFGLVATLVATFVEKSSFEVASPSRFAFLYIVHRQLGVFDMQNISSISIVKKRSKITAMITQNVLMMI